MLGTDRATPQPLSPSPSDGTLTNLKKSFTSIIDNTHKQIELLLNKNNVKVQFTACVVLKYMKISNVWA